MLMPVHTPQESNIDFPKWTIGGSVDKYANWQCRHGPSRKVTIGLAPFEATGRDLPAFVTVGIDQTRH